mmetsp:Transcript_5332/g.20764  ORF Transcript_5332/g.20764 Transcript_5332/m.20764 type:complete len:100 (-) Transcript_5332:237-536(-)
MSPPTPRRGPGAGRLGDYENQLHERAGCTQEYTETQGFQPPPTPSTQASMSLAHRTSFEMSHELVRQHTFSESLQRVDDSDPNFRKLARHFENTFIRDH